MPGPADRGRAGPGAGRTACGQGGALGRHRDAAPGVLPGRHFDVRITREKFESLVRAQIESTIGSLSRALRSAQVSPADLSAVLLVAGPRGSRWSRRWCPRRSDARSWWTPIPSTPSRWGAATLAMMLGAPPGPPPGPPPVGRVLRRVGRLVHRVDRVPRRAGQLLLRVGRGCTRSAGAPAGRPGAPPGRQGAPPGSPPGRQGPASGRPGGRPGGPVPPGRPGASAPRRGAPTGVGPAAPRWPTAPSRCRPSPRPRPPPLGTKLALGSPCVALAVAHRPGRRLLVHQFRTTALGGRASLGITSAWWRLPGGGAARSRRVGD